MRADGPVTRVAVLYQAGASTRGREFAATHSECIFVNGPDKEIARRIVADIRARAEAAIPVNEDWTPPAPGAGMG